MFVTLHLTRIFKKIDTEHLSVIVMIGLRSFVCKCLCYVLFILLMCKKYE